MRTHYTNLKIKETASAEEIRAAYRSLAQKWHPDKNDNKKLAERNFKIIKKSYETLSCPIKRAKHDEWIHNKRASEKEQASNENRFYQQGSTIMRDYGQVKLSTDSGGNRVYNTRTNKNHIEDNFEQTTLSLKETIVRVIRIFFGTFFVYQVIGLTSLIGLIGKFNLLTTNDKADLAVYSIIKLTAIIAALSIFFYLGKFDPKSNVRKDIKLSVKIIIMLFVVFFSISIFVIHKNDDQIFSKNESAQESKQPIASSKQKERVVERINVDLNNVHISPHLSSDGLLQVSVNNNSDNWNITSVVIKASVLDTRQNSLWESYEPLKSKTYNIKTDTPPGENHVYKSSVDWNHSGGIVFQVHAYGYKL